MFGILLDFLDCTDKNVKKKRTSLSTTTPPKTIGRPPKTAKEREALRESLLQAAAQVYARVDFKSLSVDDLANEAGVSRPTFYKFFPNKEAVINLLVQRANDALLMQVLSSVNKDTDPNRQLDHALLAYIDWGCRTGPVIVGIYRDAHTPGSPSYAPRQLAIDMLVRHIADKVAANGGQGDLMLIEAICIGLEHLGTMLFARKRITEDDKNKTFETMRALCQPLLS